MSSFLLGVSLSPRNQVLGRTFILAYGEASGFFCVRTISCAQKYKSHGGSLTHMFVVPTVPILSKSNSVRLVDISVFL